MSTMLQDCPPVLAAYEEFKQFSSDPVMRERVRARERFLNDWRLKIGGARREGRAEGRVEGRAEGLVEGEAKKARETAQNLKRLNVPLTTIAEATGLSVTEIERLD